MKLFRLNRTDWEKFQIIESLVAEAVKKVGNKRKFLSEGVEYVMWEGPGNNYVLGVKKAHPVIITNKTKGTREVRYDCYF